jgi:hypothetical protein
MGDMQGDKRSWRVELNIGLVQRLKNDLDWDVQEEDDLQRLFEPDGIEDIVNILWVCVEEQARMREITQEQFAARLGGDAIGDAHDALVESLKNFFMARRLAPLARVLERQEAILKRAMEKAAEKVDELADGIDADLDARLDEAWERQTTGGSGLKSGESQVSSE